MNVKNKNLEIWLSEQDKSKFPQNGKVDYYKQYELAAEYLNHNVHNHVNTIAAYKDGGFLTDHGPDHIKSVIRKASELVNTPEFDLEPYEVYLLLMAIHFHDVGHIKDGRYQHEISSKYIIKYLGSRLGTDVIEKMNIYKIAEAHGGKINGNKDKISQLLEKTTVLNCRIRPQLLAAILRLADELSEDRTRACRYLIETGDISKTRTSEIYHRYAYSLHSVSVDLEARSVEMSFEVKKDEVLKQFGKNNDEVYLIDEIYKRTLKTYIECQYCMRFIPINIQIKSIIVKIEFIDDDEFQYFRAPIKYQLTETGYPDINNFDIFKMCPNELSINGENLTGSKLKALIERELGEKKNE
jgi:hypothetical protein